jgi:hypothetical protein
MNKYIAEFIGTFFLVLTVGCTVTRRGGRNRSARDRRFTNGHGFCNRKCRSAALASGQLYGWTGTFLGGRPSTEIGNFGSPYPGNIMDALAGASCLDTTLDSELFQILDQRPQFL